VSFFTAGAVLAAAVSAAAPVTAAPPTAATVEKSIRGRLAGFKGELGVYARNLDTGETIAVNADQRFPTASVIKVAVMVEVFHQIAEGKIGKDQLLTLDEGVKVEGSGVLSALRAGSTWSVGDLLYLMIAISDNTATNLLVDLVGTKNVDDRMVAYGFPQIRLYRATFRQGKPEVFPEEEKEFGLGSSTPRQMAGLLEAIARGQVVSEKASEEMMALLRRQQDVNMIPRRLPEREDVVIGCKSGTTSEPRPDAKGVKGTVRNDVGVVKTKHGRYVIAIFTRRGQDTRDGIENASLLAGADVSRLVFDHWDGRPGR
jgi:beta-lactamase class A